MGSLLCNPARLPKQPSHSQACLARSGSSMVICLLQVDKLQGQADCFYLPGCLKTYGLSAGLFDVSKEVARLNKQREKLEKDLAGIMGRVNNSRFMDKAPPKVVAETMQQKEDAEQKVSAIMQKIEQMSELARA